MQLLRSAFSQASGVTPIAFPEPLPLQDYGEVYLDESVSLLDAIPDLLPSGGVYSKSPERMENYNQSWATTR